MATVVEEVGEDRARNDEKRHIIKVSDETAHQISTDPWYQVAFVLTTGINSSYVLGYSGSIMVPLGWIGGVVGLLLAAAISLNANILVARLHNVGGKRQIRYRDLAGHIYGKKMYCLTWALQYVNLFMINTGYIILAGQALKAIYVLYRDDGALKLPYCIAIAGVVCALFAFGIPHLSALRIWLGFSTLFSFVYIVIAFVLSLRDGLNRQERDYRIPTSHWDKIFGTIGAVANLVFAYNTGMLPEIQATIKEPAIKNMEKALWFQFTIGGLPLYAVTFMGYWAYGSSTSSYLFNSVHGPVWVKTVANIASFLQTVIALHVTHSNQQSSKQLQLPIGRNMSIIRRRSDVFDPFTFDLWDPFEGFPFSSSLSFPRSSLSGETSAFAGARFDWKETAEAHVFKADLPGLKKEEVKVEVEEGSVLKISGERKREEEEKTDTWHRIERSTGSFLRRFRLPENAKANSIKAAMENGVLTVTVPKEEVKKQGVKSIDISG